MNRAGWSSLSVFYRRSAPSRAPPTPKIGNRGLTGLALGVCVSGCGGGAPHPIGGGSSSGDAMELSWGTAGFLCFSLLFPVHREVELARGFGGFGDLDAILRKFGQLGEQRIEAGTRFWRVWRF